MDSARSGHHQAAQSEKMRISTSKCIPSHCNVLASCLEPSLCIPARTGAILMQSSYMRWPDSSSNASPARSKILVRCTVHHQAAQSEKMRISTSKCIPSHCNVPVSCLEPFLCIPARTGAILMQSSYMCWPDSSSNASPARSKILVRCTVHHQAAQSEEMRISTSKCIPSHNYVPASFLEPSVCSPATTGVILKQLHVLTRPI